MRSKLTVEPSTFVAVTVAVYNRSLAMTVQVVLAPTFPLRPSGHDTESGGSWSWSLAVTSFSRVAESTFFPTSTEPLTEHDIVPAATRSVAVASSARVCMRAPPVDVPCGSSRRYGPPASAA